MEFSHLKDGKAVMVDVTGKAVTVRKTAALLFGGTFKSRVAKSAISKVHEFVPMAHPLPLSPVSMKIRRRKGMVETWIECEYKTGLELEALMAAAGCLSDTPYLGFAAVVHKEGGKSGTMSREAVVFNQEFNFEPMMWYRVVGKGWIRSTGLGLEKVPDFELEEGDVLLCSLK